MRTPPSSKILDFEGTSAFDFSDKTILSDIDSVDDSDSRGHGQNASTISGSSSFLTFATSPRASSAHRSRFRESSRYTAGSETHDSSDVSTVRSDGWNQKDKVDQSSKFDQNLIRGAVSHV